MRERCSSGSIVWLKTEPCFLPSRRCGQPASPLPVTPAADPPPSTLSADGAGMQSHVHHHERHRASGRHCQEAWGLAGRAHAGQQAGLLQAAQEGDAATDWLRQGRYVYAAPPPRAAEWRWLATRNTRACTASPTSCIAPLAAAGPSGKWSEPFGVYNSNDRNAMLLRAMAVRCPAGTFISSFNVRPCVGEEDQGGWIGGITATCSNGKTSGNLDVAVSLWDSITVTKASGEPHKGLPAPAPPGGAGATIMPGSRPAFSSHGRRGSRLERAVMHNRNPSRLVAQASHR
jgi:hypothetical protein